MKLWRIARPALAGLVLAAMGATGAAAQDVNLAIGDLPAGKRVVVTFRTQVDSLTDQVLPAVENKGNVDATNVTAFDTNTVSTTLDSLSLGNRVFIDGNGNQLFDVGEGVLGAAVTLFADDGTMGGILDTGDTLLAGPTATGADGLYGFTGLAPGDYIVRVDASSFAAAAPLDGFSSLPGAPDPDDNVDHDDNGVDDLNPAANGIASKAITLAYNTEITAGTGNDDNPTLDLGFVEGPDIEITKTESIDPVIAGSGAGNLVYVITAKNNGPVNATGLAVTDTLTLPAGVTIDSAVPSGSTSVSGMTSPITWTIGNLANSAMETLTVTLTVAANAAAGTDVISDTAAVTALTEPDSNPTNNSATEATSVARQANLEVTKTESADPVLAGSGTGNLTYVVTLKNLGPSDASGITVSEDLTLPAGVTVDSITPSAGSFATTTAPDGTWTVGDLALDASATLTVVLTVGPSAAAGTDVVGDTATVTGLNETDPTPANNMATVATSVTREVDLEVTKTESADPVVAGSAPGNLTYVVKVENKGTSDASGVEITEDLTLPAGVTVDSITPSAGSFATTTAPDGTWTVGTLAAGAMETLTVVLDVEASAAAGTDVIADTASVSAVNETDTDNTNDSATEATSVENEADLELTAKTDAPDPVAAGANLTYTIDYVNNGPSDASSVEVADVLPAGTTFVSSTKPGTWGSIVPAVGASGTVRFLRTTSPAGESVSFTITVKVASSVASGATIDNTATVSSSTLDPGPGSDSAMASTTVVTQADLAVTKTEDIDPAAPGGTVIYTVTVDNAGPSDALNVVVTDTLPAGVTFVQTVGCVEDPAGVPTCSLGTIAAGGSAQYTVEVTIDKPAAAGLTSVTNQADVASDTTDPSAGNDMAFESTAIAAQPDLAIVKDDAGITSTPGAVIAYTLSFDNNGDQNATGVKVTETVPANTTFNEAASGGPGVWSCADGAPATTVCEHLVGGLGGTAPVSGIAGVSGGSGARTTHGGKGSGSGPGSFAGGSVTFAVTVDPGVDLSVVTQIDNTADIEDDGANGADGNPADNTSSDSTPLAGDADLAIVLTQNNDKPAGGGVQLYTAVVTNSGPDLARDVEATLQLPALSDFLGIVGDAGTTCTVDAANLVTCDLGDLAASDTRTTTVGARLDPRGEGDKLVESEVTGTVASDPLPGNETSDVATSVVRPQFMAPVEFVEGAVTRRVLGITLKEGDESVALGAYDAATGATLGYHVSGLGQRPVAIAGIDDTSALTGSGFPAADFAILSDAFAPLDPVLVSVVDADTQDLESSFALAGPGDLLPIDLAALPSFGGTTAQELAVLFEDRVDSLAKVSVLDAGSFALLGGYIVSADPADFPLFVESVPDLNANLASEVAVTLRNADTGEIKVVVLDGATGAVLGDHSFGTTIFPLGLAGPLDGAGPLPELAILLRDPGTGALTAAVFDPGTGGVSALTAFDPALVPGGIEELPDFGDLPTAEIAVLGRLGTDLKVEVRDSGPGGGLVSGFPVAMPPTTLVPLDLAVVPDFAAGPAPELAILSNVFGGDSMVEVVDALSGTPGFSAFLLP